MLQKLLAVFREWWNLPEDELDSEVYVVIHSWFRPNLFEISPKTKRNQEDSCKSVAHKKLHRFVSDIIKTVESNNL